MAGDVNVRQHLRRHGDEIPKSLRVRRQRRDTRRIFLDYASRKTEWKEMKKIAFQQFSPEEQAHLQAMPRKSVSPNVSVFNRMFKGGGPLEWIVKRDGKTYYVDTEGFDYARYGFEIDGFPNVAFPRTSPPRKLI